MIALNLEAKTDCEKIVKQHLEQMVSETLAEKINNGVTIEKDGKHLVNKKTLATFMLYATEQVKGTIPKEKQRGAQQCSIDGEQIMSWAIHYFEEDSIEGTLYNLDGTEYKPAPAPAPVKKSVIPTYTPPAPKPKPQMSIFDDLLKTEQTANAPTMPESDDEKTDGDDEEADAWERPEEELGDDSEADDEAEGNDKEEAADDLGDDSEADDEAEGNDKEEAADDLGDDEPEEQGTPFYQCYQKFAAKYSDAVLFLRLGDFYEALGDHAIKISDALGLTLTGRDCGLSERVPMCGVPYHAFEVYLAKLLERGFKVAVAEDLTGYHFAGENNSRIDEETGEVLPAEPQTEKAEDDPLDGFDTSAFDKEALCILSDLFGDDIDVR